MKVLNIEKVQKSINKVNCYVWLSRKHFVHLILKIHGTSKQICTILNGFKIPCKKLKTQKLIQLQTQVH